MLRTRTALLIPLLALTAPVAEASSDDPRAACLEVTRDLVDRQIDSYRAQALARRQQALLRQQPVPQLEDLDETGVADARAFGRAESSKPNASSSAPMAAPMPKSKPRPTSRARPSAPARRARRSSAASTGAAFADKAAEGPRTYSRTNTQELMVDEGDIVKTDGRRIYHVSCRQRGHAARCRDEIRVYSSWPAKQTQLESRYRIPSRAGGVASIRQLYLAGSQLIVLLDGAHGRASRVVTLDMADPQAPTIVREVEVDGRFVESRRIGDDLYLATASSLPRAPAHFTQQVQAALTTWSDAQLEQARPTADEVLARLPESLRGLSPADLGLPMVRRFYGEAVSTHRLYDCDTLRMRAPMQGELLNLARVDLADETSSGAGVTGYGPQAKVYASEAAFYVATQANLFRGQGWRTATEVRKFALGEGGPRFVAAGKVRGLPLNQFSMSEFEGHLRIATSDGWANNGLYVLAQTKDRLETIGNLEGFGRGERIYAVRMMGAKGYVVTFRRTDPLYTLDLTRPTQPMLAGKLHVEGWSSYLHPLDEDHLLAIGQDATARGQTIGFHMQIFDVKDPRHPQRVFHERLEAGSVSGAQSDHHAFMFEPTTKTLALPWKGRNYWGLVAYRVDAQAGFTRLGRVNHASMYKRWFQQTCRRVDRGECAKKSYWWRFFERADLDVDRVVAIDGHLYSLSPSGVMVHRVGRRGLKRVRANLVSVPAWPSRAKAPYGAVAVRSR